MANGLSLSDMDILCTLESEAHPDFTSERNVASGAREKTHTLKGLFYAIDRKAKSLNTLFAQLKKGFSAIESKLTSDDITGLRNEHSKWLVQFEDFLQTFNEFSALAPEDERFDDRSALLHMYKRTIDGWMVRKTRVPNVPVLIGPNDSTSRVSGCRSGVTSLKSSLSSAKLKEQQKRAELSAKMEALEKRRSIELARLNLKLQEEQLELKTEMNIVDAKSKVIERFEHDSKYNKNSNASVSSDRKSDKSVMSDSRLNGNVASKLEPLSDVKASVKSFVPRKLCHKECFGYDKCMFSDASVLPCENVAHSVHVPQNFVPNEFLSEVRQNDQIMASVVRQLRKPVPDIKKFAGDPLSFKRFIRQFKTKIVVNSEDDDERFNYLEQFTEGEARKIVDGFSYLDATLGYPLAIKELHQRYGDEEVLANAFVNRALSWGAIKSDNPKALDEFAIFLNECDNAILSIEAVKVLQYPENMKRLVSKLPFHYHDKWRSIVQQIKCRSEIVSFHDLTMFVKTEAKKACDPTYGREALRVDGKAPFNKAQVTRKQTGSYATNVAETDTKEHSVMADKQSLHGPCLYCNGSSHSLEVCRTLSKLDRSKRIEFVKAKGLCFGCLKSGHRNGDCKNKCKCLICKGRHPTVLHDEARMRKTTESPGAEIGNNIMSSIVPSCASQFSNHTGAGKPDVTMAVIPVQVKLKNGLATVKTYAFLDPGSSVSFCTNNILQRLGGNGKRMRLTLDTMGVPHTMTTCAVDGLQIGDLDFKDLIDLPTVYTKETMPISREHIPTSEDIAEWDHLKDVSLPVIPAEIGLLIGNNVPDAYTPIELRTGPRSSPHATRSLLGWIVWNVLRKDISPDYVCNPISVNNAVVTAIENECQCKQLDKTLRDCMNLEFPERQIDDQREYSIEDKRFIDHVDQCIAVKDGHYYIDLPFKRSDISLPNNRVQAVQRLGNLKRKLERNSEFKQNYVDFMSGILEKGYAERIPDEHLTGSDGRVWYIPHHGVYHPRKLDKLRVVFDCSALYLGVSLNNVLLQGPDLTNNLLGVLLRFREESIAIMGDIEAMYYQVRVPAKDTDFLRFLWWPNGDMESSPEEYRMLVHLFGAVSSPSCANYALRHTAVDNAADFRKLVVDGISRQFYVDDYLASTRSEEEAISLMEDTVALCSNGGFRLTKWISNSHDVLESIPESERAKDIKMLDLKMDVLPSERALGVYWETEMDTLSFKVQEREVPCTRRGILSLSSSIYDPLGFTAPFTLIAKCILQDLCRQKAGWDDVVQGPNQKKWSQWVTELKCLENLKVDRCYKPKDFETVVSCQLHHFSDASDKGYGMASYLRFVNQDGRVHCSFVFGKARVTPLKRITIPRLELTAATALVRTDAMLLRELNYAVDNSYFWTDSMSVLRYIANDSCRLHTFVANRVSLIQEASDLEQWNYVESKSNPADYASRGLSIHKLQGCTQWFNGPDFLWKSIEEWPHPSDECTQLDFSTDLEVKKPVNAGIATTPEPMDRLINYFSDWTKLRKTVAWFIKACYNLKRWVIERNRLTETDVGAKSSVEQTVQHLRQERLLQCRSKDVFKTHLTVALVQKAEKALICYVQNKHFGTELKALANDDCTQRKIPKGSCLSRLDPFLADGIIRVGGRLEHSFQQFEAKHPIVLPRESPLSKLILRDTHEAVGHLGKNAILAKVRQQFWIIGAKTEIKRMLSTCVICKKYQSPVEVQKMASLPTERLTPDEPPFSRVGVDYFGPYEVKRGRSVVKRYGVIFTCLACRAVHLEVAAKLDTDSCILAIRRFIARRGPIRFMRSDNGSNLIGAERELREAICNLNSQRIQGSLLKDNITWEFNPPTGSHFGGVWERLIRLVRKVMHSLLHTQVVRLDDEGFHTLFCEIEAVLNGRPITEAPNTPNDLDALTPNHILLLRAGESLPPGAFDQTDVYPKRRWRQIGYLADVFWRRWTSEYLPLLQQRQKWLNPTEM